MKKFFREKGNLNRLTVQKNVSLANAMDYLLFSGE